MKYLGIDMTKNVQDLQVIRKMQIKTKISFYGSHTIRSIKTENQKVSSVLESRNTQTLLMRA